jgi:hypothetical protein
MGPVTTTFKELQGRSPSVDLLGAINKNLKDISRPPLKVTG